MTPGVRSPSWTARATWLLWAGAVASVGLLAYGLRRLPSHRPLPRRSLPTVAWRRPDLPARDLDWSVFHGSAGPASDDSGIAQRLRLAGTFIAYGGSADNRRAIVDDLAQGVQEIVAEGDLIDDIRVLTILTDRVVVLSGDQEETLWLSFSKPGGAGSPDGAGGGDQEGRGPHPLSKFGTRQIGPNRWIFDRAALLDYYSELRDEPERLVAVFDSLKPIYTDDRRIEGYRLGVEGEGEFFEAVGLKPEDVVRSVNSMKMTSRRRAEYFISEFVADRANAFVIDIERGGKPEKLIYQVR